MAQLLRCSDRHIAHHMPVDSGRYSTCLHSDMQQCNAMHHAACLHLDRVVSPHQGAPIALPVVQLTVGRTLVAGWHLSQAAGKHSITVMAAPR